ncbi:helix-turn-helix domain-containing protein [Pararobbsia silviterrae]|uniref:Transposase n=1 Tax=Pararobbsia silviterrae TaxID=1792498 RepID=A0A494XMN2_9BURK|nr:helix-turn-helix domain-containing protein [Pararobbsia silviterrae]RKP51965.1 transposase [Pararobbsia silviterrae]
MAHAADELPTVVRRMEAGRMLLAGATVRDVAAALHISPGTVRRYQVIVQAGGLDALKLLGVGGRVSALDRDALDWIAAALTGSARVHGFDTDAWTNARLRAVIEAQFGVRYSRVYIWQIATNLGLGHCLTKSKR